MKQLLRTAGLVLAVLFLFLLSTRAQFYVDKSVCNAMGPWGIDFPTEVLIGIGMVVLCTVFFWILFFAHGKNLIWGVLFLSGGVSNLFERMVVGCVTDYVSIATWFPLFNLADIFLSVAVLGFLWENKGENFKY